MSIELILLALASMVRPTSLAATSAFSRTRHDVRLLLAYIVAGLAFTVAFGVIVVGAFHGVHFGSGSDRTKGIADIVGGSLALLFGCAVLSGRIRRRSDHDDAGAAGGWKARLDRRLTFPPPPPPGRSPTSPGCST